MWYFRAKDDLRFLHALRDVTNQYLATDHRLQWFKEKGQYHYRDHRGNMNEEGSDLHKKLQADWYEQPSFTMLESSKDRHWKNGSGQIREPVPF